MQGNEKEKKELALQNIPTSQFQDAMVEKFDWLREQPIAHRGLHGGDAPENSLAAFQNAIDHQHAVELDIFLLKDNRIAVFHDDTLTRMCGANVAIETLCADDLASYPLLSTNERIPLLEEVLNLVKGQVPILIEIKSNHRNRFIHKYLMELLDGYQGELAVESFNPFLLSWFVKHTPHIIRGQLSGSFAGENMSPITKKLLQHYRLSFISKPHFIAHEVQDIGNQSVKRMRNKGKVVLAWTVRGEDDYKRAAPYCDNIIFENFTPHK